MTHIMFEVKIETKWVMIPKEDRVWKSVTVWSHVLSELKGLFVQLYSWMTAVKHVLKGLHGWGVEGCVGGIVHMKIQGFLWIINVKLGIDGRWSRSWKERSDLVIKATLNFEHIRPSSISVDCPVLIASQRSHRQCIVVVVNAFTKLLAHILLAWEKMEKLWWWIVELWDFRLSTATALAKFRRVGGRDRQLLSSPLQWKAPQWEHVTGVRRRMRDIESRRRIWEIDSWWWWRRSRQRWQCIGCTESISKIGIYICKFWRNSNTHTHTHIHTIQNQQSTKFYSEVRAS